MALRDVDFRRLEKLVGLLGSEFDGERATAAGMIARMAREHKLSMAELLLRPVKVIERVEVMREAPRQEKPRASQRKPCNTADEPPEGFDTFLEALAAGMEEFPGAMTPWERDFAADIVNRYGDRDDWLSEKQRAVIDRILAKFSVAAAKSRA